VRKSRKELVGLKATDRKEVLTKLLQVGDFEQASALLREDKNLLNFAYRLLYNEDPFLRYKAGFIMALGLKDDPGMARRIMERLMWAMNDESGTYCPGALVASAQILATVPEAGRGFAPPIASMVLEEDANEDTLWAVGTLATVLPDDITFVQPRLFEFLQEESPSNIRGLALRALLRFGAKIPEDLLRSLARDEREVRFFENGRLVVTSVAGVLREYRGSG